MKHAQWFTSTVVHGKKLGRELGFPTINLENPSLLTKHKMGVYAACVKINGIMYKAALYFGPDYQHPSSPIVIEINIFDFSKNVYSEVISFQLVNFLRPPKKFQSEKELSQQISLDCQAIEKLLSPTKC